MRIFTLQVALNKQPLAAIAQEPMLISMLSTDSTLDNVAIGRARALLRTPETRQRMWPVLAAAAFAAISALAFATAMVMAPPVMTRSVAISS
jgi:hypothetical protein